jgi:hypothetical protein
MSATATATPTTNPASYLPPPPQAVANTPTPQQQMDAGNAQFNALLKLINGGRGAPHKPGCRCKVCTNRRRKKRGSLRRHTKKRNRSLRRSHTTRRRLRRRRRFGGTTTTTTSQPLSPQKIEVATVPPKGNEVSYPSTTDMQVKLAGTIAQNGANAAMDSTTKPNA